MFKSKMFGQRPPRSPRAETPRSVMGSAPRFAARGPDAVLPVQRKAGAGADTANATDSPSGVFARRGAYASEATPQALPLPLKAGVESLSGLAMDDVRVHYNSARPAQLHALAFAQGAEIHLAPGQERHLPHEAWHVVQQAQGRVPPTARLNRSIPVNNDKGLETEAERMGGESLQRTPGYRRERLAPRLDVGVVQRVLTIDGVKVEDAKGSDEDNVGDAKRAAKVDTIRTFLGKHGVHFYHSHRAAAENLGLGGHRVYTGKDGAVALAKQLQGDSAAESPNHNIDLEDGKQEVVQRKLVEVCELVRIRMGVEPSPELTGWYDKFILNGLCVGFVKMLELYPEWTVAMWEAMRTWAPPHGVSPDEVLVQLNAHIQTKVPFDTAGVKVNFMEAVILAKESYRLMKEPEAEDEQYQDTPEFLSGIGVKASTLEYESVHEKEKEVLPDDRWKKEKESEDATNERKGKSRWRTIKKRILANATDANATYHATIYTEAHQMAVRFEGKATEAQSFIVSETEEIGIFRCSSWEGVEKALKPWLAMAGEVFGVEVKRLDPTEVK